MNDLRAHTVDRYFAPVVFGDHYFVVEQSELGSLMTVIGNDEKKPVFEVFQNHPMETDYTQILTTNWDTLTARDRRTGAILYILSGTKITLSGLLLW